MTTAALKVTQPHSSSPLVEIMQNKNVRFAIAKPLKDGSFECLTPYVKCRDYLKDMMFCKYVSKKPLGAVYGFDTNKYKFDEISDDFTYVSIVCSKENANQIKKKLDKLFLMEEKWGLQKSEITTFTPPETMHGDCGFLCKADVRWQKSLLGYSLYTFLFRAFAYPDVDKIDYNEDLKMWNSTKKLMQSVKSFDDIEKIGFYSPLIEKYEKEGISILRDLHNYYGLMWVSIKLPMCPEYYDSFQNTDGVLAT